MIFEDKSFPANESSIDGRTRKPNNSASNIYSVAHVCKCNMTPKLRQVYKEGKNQGRYFYGCALKSCSYFAWDDGSFVQSNSSSSSSSPHFWKRFTSEEGWVMVGKNGFSPEHVRQGGIGDCWFLSALAVIAERPDLIEHIVVTRPQLNSNGKSEFRLFVEGDWQVVEVDNQLPCRKKKTTGQKRKLGMEEEEVLSFAKSYNNSMLWVPLLEKAYAKIHGTRNNNYITNITGIKVSLPYLNQSLLHRLIRYTFLKYFL